MIIKLLLFILILILLSSVLLSNSKREGLDQLKKNKKDLKKLKQDYNKNLIIKKEVSNLEDMVNTFKKNIKKLIKRIKDMTYSTMNTSAEDAKQPPPQAPSWMFD
tara:strand:- start:2717 stop:3031 length:315 start_codon:yes stop_codon:yes gene_type:complete